MMRTRIVAMTGILAAAVMTAAAQEARRDLSAEVMAKAQEVRLGESILVSVRVTNQATVAVTTSRGATAFDCFEVTGPDGRRLPYIGFDGQVAANQVEVRPRSAMMIAEAIDLTDKYLFRKPGRYSIRFRGEDAGPGDSPAVAIQIAPGELSDFDRFAAALIPVCPDGWHLSKDARGEVTPFGRTRVPGFALHLCRDHMRGEAVLLWFTREQAKPDGGQPPRGTAEYLGRASGFFVYSSVGQNTPALWPAATEDISRALRIKERQ